VSQVFAQASLDHELCLLVARIIGVSHQAWPTHFFITKVSHPLFKKKKKLKNGGETASMALYSSLGIFTI
jgi:hypothetical protein